jgi:hypothetical protein
MPTDWTRVSRDERAEHVRRMEAQGWQLIDQRPGPDGKLDLVWRLPPSFLRQPSFLQAPRSTTEGALHRDQGVENPAADVTPRSSPGARVNDAEDSGAFFEDMQRLASKMHSLSTAQPQEPAANAPQMSARTLFASGESSAETEERIPSAAGRPRWLWPGETAQSPETMRFFVQPRWADGPYEKFGGFRLRRTHTYDEVEFEASAAGGAIVAVLYAIDNGPSSVVVAASFEDLFIEVWAELQRLPERERAAVFAQLQRSHPTLAAAVQRGRAGYLENTALIHENDVNDGSPKHFLIALVGNRPPGSPRVDERTERAFARVLRASNELLHELNRPIDVSGVRSDLRRAAMGELLGNVGRFVYENRKAISGILSSLLAGTAAT